MAEQPDKPKKAGLKRLEDYPLEVLEAVLAILLARKDTRRGASDGD